jgi:hypothetical protein
MKNQIVQNIKRIIALIVPFKANVSAPQKEVPPMLHELKLEELQRRYIDDRTAQIIAMSRLF